jgi:hypothetical protein
VDESTFESIVFRLRDDAVQCDREGFRIAGWQLLLRDQDAPSHSKYRLPPIEDLEGQLRRIYGYKVSGASKLAGLQAVADALNRGEVARAQITALLLKLPDPAVAKSAVQAVARRLHNGGWLLKEWEPDEHPRTGTPPNPGWFAPTNGGSGAEDRAPASATPGGSAGSQHTSTGAENTNEHQVAVLTKNFGYACRVLKLDPIEATEILHQLKEAAGLGGADNCTFDTETGDVFYNGEHIGNLGD